MQDIILRRRIGANQFDYKYELSAKTKVFLCVAATLLTMALLAVTAYKISKFFEFNQLMFRAPVVVRVQSPVYVVKRQPQIVIEQATTDEENVSPLSRDQQYLCNKFGKDCATALAIFRAESHYNPKALHINKNNTVDIGCMQINSVHLAKIDTSNVNLLNCRNNIDVAYTIYKQWKGFGAWSAYTNGAYKQYLLNN
jgi:hypothetical protein